VTTKVRVVDALGGGCSGHVFDLNDVVYSHIATESGATAGCSGEINVRYRPVDCSTVGITTGGIKVSILANQCDPWCPPFWFSNVGNSGGIFNVKVSSDGGITWNNYQRQAGNGARWDCQSGQGTYLAKALSFQIEACALGDLPSSCTSSGEVITVIDALPTNWCSNGASPCSQQTFQLALNLGSGTSTSPSPSPSSSSASSSGGTPSPSPSPSPGATSGGCSGTACPDTNMCRSKYGHCGSTAEYCNSESTWQSDCSTGGTSPTPSASGNDGSGGNGGAIAAAVICSLLAVGGLVALYFLWRNDWRLPCSQPEEAKGGLASKDAQLDKPTDDSAPDKAIEQTPSDQVKSAAGRVQTSTQAVQLKDIKLKENDS